ncbi:Uncharacterized protein LSUE1_G007653 [Lachnellula suecica]|uniref:Uncharacterized protein n=1 Tax=Lachnellula suecica TaxID=602035 RepID=A0A8T9C0C0_9HELO|nr:Uncharacterized protein LSUE1_G007653 [Lachnellula suecica]
MSPTPPQQYSLAQLYQKLEPKDGSQSTADNLQNLQNLNSCLSKPDRLLREQDDDEDIIRLCLWISKVILPDGSFNVEDDMSDGIPHPQQSASLADICIAASRERALALTHQKASLGLQSLQILISQLSSLRPSTLDPKILLTLIAFTSPADPWTTPTTTQLSSSVLALYTTQTHSEDFILRSILNTIIRPLFSLSKPSTITSAGRKAMPSSGPLPKHDVAAERSSKPWKYETIYAIRIFSWAIENAPPRTISQNWPLFTPPLLTLLDDPSTPHRVTGSLLLPTFLPHLSPQVLRQSGIGEVFTDALMPTLLYLPSLTPISEALQLSGAAYAALHVLCDVRFPSTAEDGENGERYEFLDKVMRKGVLTAYHHASQHPSIVALLLSQADLLIAKMGIQAVKHLKALIPVLCTTLADPFAPDVVLEAARCLQTVLLNCWPRIGGYRMEIVRALCLAWRDGGEGNVRRELEVAGRLFGGCCGGGG